MYVTGTMNGKPFEHYEPLAREEVAKMLRTPEGKALAELAAAAEAWEDCGERVHHEMSGEDARIVAGAADRLHDAVDAWRALDD
jgi:hypothetical protein